MSLAGSHLHPARIMRGHRGSFLGAVLLLVLLAGLAGDLGHSSRGIGKHGRSASGVHTLPRRSREAVALDATSGAVKTPSSAASSSSRPRGVDPCAGERASGSGDPGRGDGVVALVTGGAGFIGSHLADELLRLGYRVRVLDNLSTGKAEYVDNRVDFIDGDVRDADAVNRAMRPWGAAGTFESPEKVAASVQSGDAVAVVFHLAAMSKVGPSLNDPDMVNFCVENNVVGTENVLRAALRVGTVRKVIYAASSTYYGNQPAPFAETLPMEISSPYAVTKHQGELLMRVYDRVHDLPTVNLRFFMVYGERQPTSGAYAVMTGIFLSRRERGEPLTVEGDGTHFRDFVHVHDVVRSMLLAWERRGLRDVTVNVGSGRAVTVNEVAEMVGGEITHGPARVGDLEGTLADTCAAKRTLGFEARKVFEDEIRAMVHRVTAKDSAKGELGRRSYS